MLGSMVKFSYVGDPIMLVSSSKIWAFINWRDYYTNLV